MAGGLFATEPPRKPPDFPFLKSMYESAPKVQIHVHTELVVVVAVAALKEPAKTGHSTDIRQGETG